MALDRVVNLENVGESHESGIFEGNVPVGSLSPFDPPTSTEILSSSPVSAGLPLSPVLVQQTEPLATLENYFSTGAKRETSYSDRDIQEIARLLRKGGRPLWGDSPRLYIVYRLIGQLHQLDVLLQNGIFDVWFPFTQSSVPEALTPVLQVKFLEAQTSVLTKAVELEKLESKPHIHFKRQEKVPFEKRGILGKGGFAVVDKVYSPLSRRDYARKRFPKRMTLDGNKEESRKDIQRFLKELGVLKRLRHPHHVELVASYTDVKYLGLIMSPVADCNLKVFYTRVVDQPDRLALMRSFYGCLVNGLLYLHGQKIRHRDIKPENILVKGERVYFTDFGISLDWSSLSSSRGTTTDDAGGTFLYCAPEEDKRNTSSDIWSLGCVFLEMCTVLHHRTIGALREHFKARSGEEAFYENVRAIQSWLESLSATQSKYDEYPLTWTASMLKMKPEDRPSANDLFNKIVSNEHMTENGEPMFCRECCFAGSDGHSTTGSASDGELWDQGDSEVMTSPLTDEKPKPVVSQLNSFASDSVSHAESLKESLPLIHSPSSFPSTAPSEHQNRAYSGNKSDSADANSESSALLSDLTLKASLQESDRATFKRDSSGFSNGHNKGLMASPANMSNDPSDATDAHSVRATAEGSTVVLDNMPDHPVVYAKVLLEFRPTLPGHLALEVGDEVKVTDRSSSPGWWCGSLRGQTGLFPASHVRVLDHDTKGQALSSHGIRLEAFDQESPKCGNTVQPVPTSPPETERIGNITDSVNSVNVEALPSMSANATTLELQSTGTSGIQHAFKVESNPDRSVEKKQNADSWPNFPLYGNLPRLGDLSWSNPSRILDSVRDDRLFMTQIPEECRTLIKNATVTDVTPLLQLLVSNGLDVKQPLKQSSYDGPLYQVLTWGYGREWETLFKLLLFAARKQGESLNGQRVSGELMEESARRGFTWAIQALVQGGVSERSNKPLWEAAGQNRLNTARYLIEELHLDPTTRFEKFYLRKPYCGEFNSLEVALAKGHRDMVKFLLDNH